VTVRHERQTWDWEPFGRQFCDAVGESGFRQTERDSFEGSEREAREMEWKDDQVCIG